LRGRSGRQGDPGSSQFFVALEDEIMRIFGGEQIAKVMDFLKIEENQPIEHGMVSKSIESAQVRVETFFFDQRKRLVEYDDVLNKQREIIYERRRRLLETASTKDPKSTGLKDQILQYIQDEISNMVALYAPSTYGESELHQLITEFSKIIPFDQGSQNQIVGQLKNANSAEDLQEKLIKIALETYESKEKTTGSEEMRQLENIITISTIDEKWMDHLDAVDSLRQGIWLRGDKRTALSEYKKEAFEMFEGLIASVESAIARTIYRAQRMQPQQLQRIQPDFSKAVEQKAAVSSSLESSVADADTNSTPTPTGTAGNQQDFASALKTAKVSTSKIEPGVKKSKISRNEPCPCGSGLKYKKCGLINSPQHRG
jgi:preprotein translocase subunit SecA